MSTPNDWTIDYAALHSKVKYLLTERGLNLTSLAIGINTSDRQVRRALKGEHNAPPTLSAVAKFLQIPLQELLRDCRRVTTHVDPRSFSSNMYWHNYVDIEVSNIRKSYGKNSLMYRFVAVDKLFVNFKDPRTWYIEPYHRKLLRETLKAEHLSHGIAARIFFIHPHRVLTTAYQRMALPTILQFHITHNVATGFLDYDLVVREYPQLNHDFYVVEKECLYTISRESSLYKQSKDKNEIDKYANFFEQLVSHSGYFSINPNNYEYVLDMVRESATMSNRNTSISKLSKAQTVNDLLPAVIIDRNATDAEVTQLLCADTIKVLALTQETFLPEQAIKGLAEQGVFVFVENSEGKCFDICTNFLYSGDYFVYFERALYPKEYAEAILSGHPS